MVSQPAITSARGRPIRTPPQTGTFFANRNFDNGVSIFYSGGGHSWNLDFAAPFDAPLTPGTYANATRWPFQANGVPGLNISGDGRGSNTLTGSFNRHAGAVRCGRLRAALRRVVRAAQRGHGPGPDRHDQLQPGERPEWHSH